MSPGADFEAAVRFLRRGDLGGASVEPSALGVVVRDPAFPLRHDSNHLVVEDRRATGEAIAAEVASRGVPCAYAFGTISDDAVRSLVASGWTTQHGIVMAARRPPDRPAPRAAIVEEVDVERLRPLRERLLAAHSWATPDVVDQLQGAKVALSRRVGLRAFGARVDGEVASAADLYIGDGVAQIEDVSTAPEHRCRGLCRAIVLHAVSVARDAGARLVFLVASEDDWPKELYAKLGFDPIGRTLKLSPPAAGA